MGFRPVTGTGNGGGDVFKWTTVGQTVTGRLVGCKNGKVFSGRQSRLAVIDVGNGVQIPVPLTSDLADDKQFESAVKPGNLVKITLVELVKTKQPQPYKKFELLIDDGTEGPANAPVTSGNLPAAQSTSSMSVAQMEAALTAKVGAAGAAPMLNALKQLYADPAVFEQKLRETLKTQGVQV